MCNPMECEECKAAARGLPAAQLFEFWWHCVTGWLQLPDPELPESPLVERMLVQSQRN